MGRNSSRPTRAYGFALVELLVVVVILVALSAITMSFYLGHGGKGAPPGKAHTPMERAHDTECMNNIHQLHEGIMAAQIGEAEGKFPLSLAELKFPKEMLSCPVGKEPYVYDPTTGQVHCPHPGHENYQ